MPQKQRVGDNIVGSRRIGTIDELENWLLTAFEESTWNVRTCEKPTCTMMQPKPPLTPQTLSNSWCHSSESTSLMESLGQTDAVAAEVIAEWQMDPKVSVMDPTTAQRLVQKSGGPFDTGTSVHNFVCVCVCVYA